MTSLRDWANVPFAPKKVRFGYHWAVLAAGAVGVMMSAPGQTIGVSAFTDTLIGVLDITRKQLSFAYMIGTIGSALILPFAGALYDRWGARILAPAAAALLAVVLVLLSRCDGIADAVVRGIGGEYRRVIAFVVITAFFLLLRFSGQGVLTMASRNMVMKWFKRRRGMASMAIGLAMMGFSLAPKFFDMLIAAYDWRTAWVVAAGILAFGFVPLALAFFRDDPESCGLEPDGGPAPEGASEITYEPPRSMRLGEAACTPAFWIFNAMGVLFAAYITALAFHVVSIFGEAGLPRDDAMFIFPVSAAISTVGIVISGLLADRARLKNLLGISVAGLTVSTIGFSLLCAWPAVGMWMIIVGNGVGQGPLGITMGVVWPRYFGKEHLGKITGVSMAVMVSASAIGPAAFAWSLSATGGYRAAGLVCVAAGVAITIASRWADNPSESASPAG